MIFKVTPGLCLLTSEISLGDKLPFSYIPVSQPHYLETMAQALEKYSKSCQDMRAPFFQTETAETFWDIGVDMNKLQQISGTLYIIFQNLGECSKSSELHNTCYCSYLHQHLLDCNKKLQYSISFRWSFFRDLDRERSKMEQQEKKVIADIKKMAKAGQMVC